MTDYPDGYQRNLPGHTVEMEADYALFWQANTTLSIGAGATSSYTLNITDANYIFFIDVLSVYSYPVSTAKVILKRDAVVIDSIIDPAYVKFNPRMNPAVYWLNGEAVVVEVTNYGSGTVTSYIYVNGTKVKRPASFVRP